MSLPEYEYLILRVFQSLLLVKPRPNSLRIVQGAFFFSLLFFVADATRAQTVNGSIYSYFGIGNLQLRSSAYNRALGYTGIGVRDNMNINVINPAAYNAIAKPFTSLFELGANYEATNHSTYATSSVSKTGGLNGINFLVRPATKLGVLIGAAPLTNISFNAASQVQYASIASPVQLVAQGSGGINQFYLGASYEIFKNFSLGVNLSYFLGTIKKTITEPPTAVAPN